jgi:hypothetical protein
MSTDTDLEPRRTRLAVFGSVAAQRDPAREVATSPAVGAVLEQVYATIAADAPAIAAPLIDRAVADGRISRVERHELLRELREPGAAGPAPGTAAIGLEARLVLREALAAIRLAAPSIAQPLLDEAVAAERLTPAQEQRVLDRLRTSPAQALRNRASRRRMLSA